MKVLHQGLPRMCAENGGLCWSWRMIWSLEQARGRQITEEEPGVARRCQYKGKHVAGSQKRGGKRLKEPSLPQLFYTQMPGGSVLSPGLLPTSCHKAGEESAMHYQRSRLPQAYGQQNHLQPRASQEMFSPDPSSGLASYSPGALGYRLSGPHHFSPH